MTSNIRRVTTESDHQAALARVEALWDTPPGSPEAEELEVLATLIEDFEDRQEAIRSPDPMDGGR